MVGGIFLPGGAATLQGKATIQPVGSFDSDRSEDDDVPEIHERDSLTPPENFPGTTDKGKNDLLEKI